MQSSRVLASNALSMLSKPPSQSSIKIMPFTCLRDHCGSRRPRRSEYVASMVGVMSTILVVSPSAVGTELAVVISVSLSHAPRMPWGAPFKLELKQHSSAYPHCQGQHVDEHQPKQ